MTDERQEPRWLTRRMLDAMHGDQLSQHGGSPGTRDQGLVESALSRPKHRFTYSEACDLADLAATYAVGLAKNHGYVDGNKRIAFVAMYVFLRLNGKRLVAPEPEVVDVMIGVASGQIDQDELAGWVRDHLRDAE